MSEASQQYARSRSLSRIQEFTQMIEKLAPKEIKHSTALRRQRIEFAYEAITLYGKAFIEVLQLGTEYDPAQYLSHAQLVAERLAAIEQKEGES